MKSFSLHLVLLALVAAIAVGCNKDEDTNNDTGDAGDNTSNVADDKSSEGKITNAVLCGKCGQVKGSENCCADGHEACEKCSMHSGTMLCCVEIPEEFKGMDLCMKCGQVAGGEQCCAEGAENCEKCGMHMGAVLCCKLKKDEPDQ